MALPYLTISSAIRTYYTFGSYKSRVVGRYRHGDEPISSRKCQHFLRELSTAGTRIVARAARPAARAESALWIENAAHSSSLAFRECTPQLWFSFVVPYGAFLPAMTKE